MKRVSVLAVLALLLVSSCGTNLGMVDTKSLMTTTTAVATPQQAQKLLAEAEAARVAVRDSIARSFVTAQQNLTSAPQDQSAIKLMNAAITARTAFNKVDPQFTAAWQVAADAVDTWTRAPSDQNAAVTFNAMYASVRKSLTDLSAAQTGGVQ